MRQRAEGMWNYLNGERKKRNGSGQRAIGLRWDGENSHIGAFNFYPIFIPLIERMVSGARER